MQDVLTRLEILYPKEMRAWRKECKLRYDRSNMPGIQLIGKILIFLTLPLSIHQKSFPVVMLLRH